MLIGSEEELREGGFVGDEFCTWEGEKFGEQADHGLGFEVGVGGAFDELIHRLMMGGRVGLGVFKLVMKDV